MNSTTDIIACRPGSFRPFAAEALPLMAELGIRYIELDGLPAEDRWPAFQDEMGKLGITASSVSGYVNFAKPETVEKFPIALRAAKFFGARIAFVSAHTGGKPMDEAYQHLRSMGDMAAQNDVTIALETHPDLATNGKRAATTMLAVDHPNVRLNYDTANIYYHNQNCDPNTELLHFLPWLSAMHLKETDGGYHKHFFPGLHDEGGIVDFPRVFKICHAAGFHGPFTLEIEGVAEEKLSREQVMARMRRSLDYLRPLLNP